MILLEFYPAYYGWRGRPLSPRAGENQRLLDRIRVLHAESDGVLGAGRIRDDLHDEGESWKYLN